MIKKEIDHEKYEIKEFAEDPAKGSRKVSPSK